MLPVKIDVHHLARLARLRLSDEEATNVRLQLDGVIALVEQLKAIDTTGVEPMRHAGDMALRLRDDVVQEANQRTLLQSIAPAVDSDSGLYLLPKVID